MGVDISRNAAGPFHFYNGLPRFEVDLNQCIRDRLKLPAGDQKIAKAEAINILKSIKRRATFKSVLVKPAVVTVIGFALLGASLFLSPVATSAAWVTAAALRVFLEITSIVFLAAGTFFSLYGILHNFSGRLNQISTAYKNEALDAENKIQELELEDDDAVLIIRA